MFKCSRCLEKDNHIESLKANIAFLEKWISPKDVVPTDYAGIEANSVLNGAAQPVIDLTPQLNDEELKELERLANEEAAILSGNY